MSPETPWPYQSYKDIFLERSRRFVEMQKNFILQEGAKFYYKDKPVEFINHWAITYDPRNVVKGLPTLLPFILFPKQEELVLFLYQCLLDRESGLIEKSRDMGATWVCCAFSIWLFLFHPGSAIGWGSRKEQLVDKLGDPDSIFEKMRMMLKYLPTFFLPRGFNMERHCSYMRIVDHYDGSTITGEAGDNIGRGGRKLIYFKDESAHYERPEKIEAALGDNTDVQIDFSSVNGPGNIFHRRRVQGHLWTPDRPSPKGRTRVLVLDWRDHPLKDEDWYEARKKKAQREGLLNIFHQEVDRDYSSAVEGTLIPGPWVRAAIDAHKVLGFEAVGKEYGALDPYDEGGDSHAFAARKGSVLLFLDQWYEGDTGDATRKTLSHCAVWKVKSLQYDSIGIGAGVKSEINRLTRENSPLVLKHLTTHKWVASDEVLFPKNNIVKDDRETPLNKDFYRNLKAQGGWNLRLRFEKTYKMINKGEKFSYNELISIPSDVPFFTELIDELSQPTYNRDTSGRIIVNKKPPGTKSPNLYDVVMMAFWPVDDKTHVGVW